MRTAGPATGPALSRYKLRVRSPDPAIPRLRLFCRLNPANPFIARERANSLPCGERLRVRYQAILQIGWHFVHHTGGNFIFAHRLKAFASKRR